MPQTQGKDSPVKKCNGLNPALTPLGFVAGDGRIYHDRSKALRITRDVAKREEVIRNLQRREHARLDRLKQAAKSGDIAFTKDGVFETKPCPSCDVYHKVPYVCGVEEPCPNSYLAKYPLKKKVSWFIRMRGVANASREFSKLQMRMRRFAQARLPNAHA